MERQSARATVERWSVAVLGAVLLAGGSSHLLVGGESFPVEFIEVSLSVALSLCVVALGLWLRTEVSDPDRIVTVFRWCLAGGFVTTLVGSWAVLVQRINGQSVTEPFFTVASSVTLGVIGGGAFGVYYVRLRHRTETLAERSNRLDEFAGIVSHDLRNPLNVAEGHLELARESGAEEHFEAIEDAHARMEHLVDEVLTLARQNVTGGHVEAVDMREAAIQAWRAVDADEAQLRIATDRTIRSDGRRLRELFENLFRNAVEHGSTSSEPSAHDAVEHGGDGVTVTVGSLREGFYVEDDGPGVPPALRERVFEGGFSTRTDGTGFGLPIVRRIAVAHGWTIEVTSAETGGARFEFTGLGGDEPNRVREPQSPSTRASK